MHSVQVRNVTAAIKTAHYAARAVVGNGIPACPLKEALPSTSAQPLDDRSSLDDSSPQVVRLTSKP